MANDHAPRMPNEEYFRCLEAAANAGSASEVWRIRGEVLRKYHGDARADDLCEALHAHAARVAEATGEGGAERRPSASSTRSETGRSRSRY